MSSKIWHTSSIWYIDAPATVRQPVLCKESSPWQHRSLDLKATATLSKTGRKRRQVPNCGFCGLFVALVEIILHSARLNINKTSKIITHAFIGYFAIAGAELVQSFKVLQDHPNKKNKKNQSNVIK